MADTVSGYIDAKNRRIVLEVVGDDGTVNANYGRVVIDLDSCIPVADPPTVQPSPLAKFIKMREWDVCIKNGDGSVSEMKALFLSSAPY